MWFVVKIAFVEFVIPQRTAKRDPEPIAAELREVRPVRLTRSTSSG